MSFVKDVVKGTVATIALYAGAFIGVAAGLGAFKPVSDFVEDKTEKILGKFKTKEEEEYEA